MSSNPDGSRSRSIWQARKNREEGQAESAIKLAAQYLQFRPDDAAVTAELAEWQRERASGRKQLAGVANLYEKVLRLQADNDAIRRKAADTYLTLGQYSEAFDHLERLLQAQPNNAELLTQSGWCLQAAGKFEAAANNYRRAIQADARDASAYAYAAGLQQSQFKKPEAAGELLAQAVEANPDSPKARAALGSHLRRLRKFDEAARQVKEGLTRNPDNATLLLTLRRSPQRPATCANRGPCSIAAARSIPRIRGSFRPCRGKCSTMAGPTSQCKNCSAGKAVNPNDIDILTLLGDILAQDGQIGPLEEALRELQDAKGRRKKSSRACNTSKPGS